MGIFKSEAKQLLELGAINEVEYVIMRNDGRFSRAIVISAVVMIMFYAMVMMQFTYLNIQNHTGVFPPVEFTTGYFAFWTVEVVMLATIKKHKVKNKHETESDSTDIYSRALGRISPGGSEKAEFQEEGSNDAEPGVHAL